MVASHHYRPYIPARDAGFSRPNLRRDQARTDKLAKSEPMLANIVKDQVREAMTLLSLALVVPLRLTPLALWLIGFYVAYGPYSELACIRRSAYAPYALRSFFPETGSTLPVNARVIVVHSWHEVPSHPSHIPITPQRHVSSLPSRLCTCAAVVDNAWQLRDAMDNTDLHESLIPCIGHIHAPCMSGSSDSLHPLYCLSRFPDDPSCHSLGVDTIFRHCDVFVAR